ncbi:DUF4982 domain-containing protein [Zunongwangia sp. F117]|uniref:DUF4982 domain-containing protein n=1 Tax=Autumnicola musiva TaxID=3075589 RepID=A0ABU3D5A9_9FLAO|nr:DUF4982 domain-containing protein [Zunongwangia sp. F117]MDT0676535.1 DUF4982 domain-containing protein [Zunongwangia sp. F117]
MSKWGSLGRKKKYDYEYRFRWDEVSCRPGKLEVVTYKNEKEWARDSVVLLISLLE